ncbi:MAG: hypothetical protein RLZZ123_1865 [Pseudomonadota bacterium]|jgi:hypothetical protein
MGLLVVESIPLIAWLEFATEARLPPKTPSKHPYFDWILYDLDLKSGPHGAERSLYSLRHTAITFRLLYGGKIDLLTLAAEANVSLLHSRRSRGA